MNAPLRLLAAIAVAALLNKPATATDPFADAVVGYTAGVSPTSGDPLTSFIDPTAALGEPTRITSPASPFGGPVNPFNPPFGQDEIVSIGEGGELIVRFDEPVVDDALNPFGIDLLVFGNAFMFASNFPPDASTTNGGIGGEGGEIAVSADGVNFVPISGVDADGLFPTAAFTDVAGTLPADFTRPVDPGVSENDLLNLTFAEILTVYDGSGGGAGIDIGPLGFSEISYVRVTNPLDSGQTPEIDGFADVRAIPEPATVVLAVVALLAARRRDG